MRSGVSDPQRCVAAAVTTTAVAALARAPTKLCPIALLDRRGDLLLDGLCRLVLREHDFLRAADGDAWEDSRTCTCWTDGLDALRQMRTHAIANGAIRAQERFHSLKRVFALELVTCIIMFL